MSSCAVLFTAMPVAMSARAALSSGSNTLPTCIWFWVRVPVLSVQITVVAPIVSQACILRTRLLVLSMRRIE